MIAAAGRGFRLPALLEACRPLNVVLAVAGVVLGARFADGLSSPALAPACLAAACLVAAGYLWNDADDAARDRVAHPARAVASGRITPAGARAAAVALALAAALPATALPLATRALFAAWVVLLSLYRRIADRWPAAKNPLAAALTSSALLAGGTLGAGIGPCLVPALFAFALTLARELVKDLADAQGDAAAGSPNWIGSLAPERARSAVRVALAAVVAAIPIPALLLGYGPLYLGAAAAGVGGFALLAWRDAAAASAPGGADARLRFARAARSLKGGVALGMLSLFLARVA